MNTRFAYIAPVLTIFFACLFAALALTAVSLMQENSRCGEAGGTFSIEGGTAWCRY